MLDRRAIIEDHPKAFWVAYLWNVSFLCAAYAAYHYGLGLKVIAAHAFVCVLIDDRLKKYE